jgi:hypothetical protein
MARQLLKDRAPGLDAFAFSLNTADNVYAATPP